MFYNNIFNILVNDLGLEFSSFGLAVADILSVFLSIIFGLLPIIVSFVILFYCIRGMRR